jgi:hypothetical protein
LSRHRHAGIDDGLGRVPDGDHPAAGSNHDRLRSSTRFAGSTSGAGSFPKRTVFPAEWLLDRTVGGRHSSSKQPN